MVETEENTSNTTEGGSLRRMFSYMAPQRGQLTLAIGLTIISTGLRLVPYILIYLMIIALLTPPIDQSLVWQYAVFAAIAVIVRFTLNAWSSNLAHYAAYEVLRSLRERLAEKLGTLPLGYFNATSTGALKKVIIEDVERLEAFIAHHLIDLAGAITIPLATVLYLLTLDWRLGLVTLITIPLALAPMVIWMRSQSVRAIFQRVAEIEGQVNTTMLEYIQGMPVIRAFNQTVESFARYKHQVETFNHWKGNVGKTQAGPMALMLTLLGAGLVFVLPFGSYLYLSGDLDLPTLVLFLLLSVAIGQPLVKILLLPAVLSRLLPGEQHIHEILTAEPLPEPSHSQRPANHSIAFEQVHFGYGADTILHDVSFVAPEGTVTALVGPSGAGKSTVGKLIPRFWDVQNGAVLIGGVNVKDITSEDLMQQVAFVFQDVALFNDTVLENIRMGRPDATEEEVMAASQAAQAHEFIVDMPDGYQSIIGEGGARLSGGQKQRLSIARAILKDAPIVVLDEATAFIDPENEAKVQAAVSELISSTTGKSKTLIVIAHRLSTITEADQILVFDSGRIVEHGTHDELLKQRDLYQRMWHAHQQAHDWSFEHTPTVPTGTESPALPAPVATINTGEAVPTETSSPALNLFQSVYRIAGSDYRPRLNRSASYQVLAALCAGIPYSFLFLTLYGLFNDTLTMQQVFFYTAGIVVCIALEYFFRYRANVIDYQQSYNMLSRLTLQLGEHIRKLSMGYFTRRGTGQLSSTLTSDMNMIELLFNFFFGNVLSLMTLPVIIITALFLLDWRMALAAAITLPLAILVLFISDRITKRLGRIRQEEAVRVNARIIEYIQGMHVIKAFNQTGKRFVRLQEAIEAFKQANIAMNVKISPWNAIYNMTVEMGFVFMLLTGTYLLLNGSLVVGMFLIFLIVSLRFYNPLQQLGTQLAETRGISASVDRVNEIFAIEPLAEPINDPHLDRFDIAFDQVTFRYADSTTLDHINLVIPEHSLTALVGPSGSGKTTITNLIARFWDVQAGSITIGGQDVRHLKSDRLLSYVSCVFQDVYLFHDTIANNIRFGKADATDAEVIAAAQAARAHDFIMQLPDGYETMVGEGGATLSGGEKQRVSIARALLKDAPIVLLDEATASIDPENELFLLEAINALVQSKTVVMIAHRLATIRHAQQIVVLDHGRIVQCGTHDELVRQSGWYRRFWEERQQAHSWKIAGSQTLIHE